MLNVPHCRQKSPDACLPACVRMVLAYRGRKHHEQELVQALGTVRGLGTNPESAITGLESMGYHALWFENATLERLLVVKVWSCGYREQNTSSPHSTNLPLRSAPDLRSPISDLRSPISDLRSPISDLRSPIPGLRSPISNLRSPISGLRSPASGLRPPPSAARKLLGKASRLCYTSSHQNDRCGGDSDANTGDFTTF